MHEYKIIPLAPSRWRITGKRGFVLETTEQAVLGRYGARPDDIEALVRQADALGKVADNQRLAFGDGGSSALSPERSRLRDKAL